jgi:hypothetical protein
VEQVVVELVWTDYQPSTPRDHQEGQSGRQGWQAWRVLATRAPTRWLQSPVGWSHLQTVKRVVGSIPSLNLFCVCFESEFVFCSKILLGNALCDTQRTLGF